MCLSVSQGLSVCHHQAVATTCFHSVIHPSTSSSHQLFICGAHVTSHLSLLLLPCASSSSLTLGVCFLRVKVLSAHLSIFQQVIYIPLGTTRGWMERERSQTFSRTNGLYYCFVSVECPLVWQPFTCWLLSS